MEFEFDTNEFWEPGDDNHLTHWQQDDPKFKVVAWQQMPEGYKEKYLKEYQKIHS